MVRKISVVVSANNLKQEIPILSRRTSHLVQIQIITPFN